MINGGGLETIVSSCPNRGLVVPYSLLNHMIPLNFGPCNIGDSVALSQVCGDSVNRMLTSYHNDAHVSRIMQGEGFEEQVQDSFQETPHSDRSPEPPQSKNKSKNDKKKQRKHVDGTSRSLVSPKCLDPPSVCRPEDEGEEEWSEEEEKDLEKEEERRLLFRKQVALKPSLIEHFHANDQFSEVHDLYDTSVNLHSNSVRILAQAETKPDVAALPLLLV